MRVARRIRTGQVDINGGPFNMNAPFGGFKQSGNGREAGKYGLEEFLEYKSLQLKKPALTGASWRCIACPARRAFFLAPESAMLRTLIDPDRTCNRSQYFGGIRCAGGNGSAAGCSRSCCCWRRAPWAPMPGIARLRSRTRPAR